MLPVEYHFVFPILTIRSLLQDTFKASLEHDIEKGTVGKNRQQYLVYLMRLRQATCHPFLLEGMFRETFSIDELKKLRECLVTASINDGDDDDNRSWVETQNSDDLTTFIPDIVSSPVDHDPVDGSFMSAQLNQLVTARILERTQCRSCEHTFTHPCRTNEVSLLFRSSSFNSLTL